MSVQDAMATPAINLKGDAAFRFLGLPTQVRAKAEMTNGAFGFVENWEIPPGFASPYHTHHREDESFYIVQGEVAFVIDGKWRRVGPGAFVFGPREIPHGFKVVGDQSAQMLLLPPREALSSSSSNSASRSQIPWRHPIFPE